MDGCPSSLAEATRQGARVAFNPAPMISNAIKPLLGAVDLLIVNEVEAMDLAGAETITEAETMLQSDHPGLSIVLTLGRAGIQC